MINFPSGPDPSVAKLAKEVILQQGVIAIGSPCGSNCSYITRLTGPVFNCTLYNTSDVTQLRVAEPIGGNLSAQEKCPHCPYPTYLGAENSISDASAGIYRLDLHFYYSNALTPLQIKNTTVVSCTAYDGTYTVVANFSNGVGTFEVISTEPPTLLNPNLLQVLHVPAISIGQAEWNAQSLSIYGRMNSINLAQALGKALSGNLTVNPREDDIVANGGTMILDSAITNAKNNNSTSFGPDFNSDPEMVEQMLQNLTVSVMSFGKWNTTVAVTQLETRICHSFSKQRQLIGPCASSIALSLIFIILGFLALAQNGVSPNNGAAQIMTVAAGSSGIRKETLACSLGGAENASAELKGLRVRFWKLIDEDGGHTRMGFGTEGEIVTLRPEKLGCSA